MFEELDVGAWLGVRAGCGITYCINTEDDVDLILDDGARRFEFAIETDALRNLLEVGGQALAEMDARAGACRDELGGNTREHAADHRDNVFMATVTRVNTALGRYALRFLDADAGRAKPLGIAEERALAEQVATVVDGLRARVSRRQRADHAPTGD